MKLQDQVIAVNTPYQIDGKKFNGAVLGVLTKLTTRAATITVDDETVITTTPAMFKKHFSTVPVKVVEIELPTPVHMKKDVPSRIDQVREQIALGNTIPKEIAKTIGSHPTYVRRLVVKINAEKI